MADFGVIGVVRSRHLVYALVSQRVQGQATVTIPVTS